MRSTCQERGQSRNWHQLHPISNAQNNDTTSKFQYNSYKYSVRRKKKRKEKKESKDKLTQRSAEVIVINAHIHNVSL